MNADGSDQHLVSTGKGVTTCGYFLKDNKHIIYASTHLAGDACPAPADRSRGYVWAVYAGFDIFLATDDGKIEKRLTDTPGLRRRRHGQLEDRDHRLYLAGIARSGPVDHAHRRLGQEADHQQARLRRRRRPFRATAATWCGAPIIRRPTS